MLNRTAKSLHLVKEINLPVRPPTRLKTPLILCVAPFRAGPAEEVTLDRPCDALDDIFETVSFDFVAVSEAACAASDVVEAFRTQPCWRKTKRLCRSTSRDAAGADIEWKASNRRLKLQKRKMYDGVGRGLYCSISWLI